MVSGPGPWDWQELQLLTSAENRQKEEKKNKEKVEIKTTEYYSYIRPNPEDWENHSQTCPPRTQAPTPVLLGYISALISAYLHSAFPIICILSSLLDGSYPIIQISQNNIPAFHLFLPIYIYMSAYINISHRRISSSYQYQYCHILVISHCFLYF